MRSATVRFKLPEGELDLVAELVNAIYNTSMSGIKPEVVLRVDNEVEIDLQAEDASLVYEYVKKLIADGLGLSNLEISQESQSRIKAVGLKGRRKVAVEVEIKKIV